MFMKMMFIKQIMILKNGVYENNYIIAQLILSIYYPYIIHIYYILYIMHIYNTYIMHIL